MPMISSILLQAGAFAPITHEAAKAFGVMDPYGIAMTIIAMSVVFISLILLYLTFKYVARIYNMEIKRKKSPAETTGALLEEDISGEVNAAIALALHLYRTQLHDNEDPVITMKKVARTYSPWSSKIYGLRRPPK
jgi:glutaconyl-CoA/methylmalonyl-CoA decarboxylase subunit delta